MTKRLALEEGFCRNEQWRISSNRGKMPKWNQALLRYCDRGETVIYPLIYLD
jgi:hypothetical protein